MQFRKFVKKKLLSLIKVYPPLRVTGSPILLLATNKDIRVANVSRSNKAFTTIIKDLSDGVTLDFFYERGLVCWSDTSLEMIQCVHTNGTYTEVTTLFYFILRASGRR